MLATARHRSASTGSSTSRPCRTRNGLTRRASSPGWRRWFSDSRPPAEVALGGEKRFDHEETAGGDELSNLWQPRPVKIIEQQNRIKSAEVRPRPLEIHHAPVHRETLPLGELSRSGKLSSSLSTPTTDAPAAAAASACRPAPHARSNTRIPGPEPMSVPDEPGARPREVGMGGIVTEGIPRRERHWRRSPRSPRISSSSAAGSPARAWRATRRCAVFGRCSWSRATRRGNELTIQPADSRRPALSGDRRRRTGARGQPRATDPAPDRATPRLAAAIHLSAAPGRPDFPLAPGRRHVGIRRAGSVPECATPPDARQACATRRRAHAARARSARAARCSTTPSAMTHVWSWPRPAPPSTTARWSRTIPPSERWSGQRDASSARSWRIC